MKKNRIAAILGLVLMLLATLSGCRAGPANPDANGDALQCNWILKVDQTIPVKEGDVTVNHTLVLIARKEGGTDVYGTYEGAAYIGSHLDVSELSKMFIKMAGGFDVDVFANNLTFEIEPFDMKRYSAYGSEDEASVAPLVKYESMALLSPEMKGGVIINPTVKSSDGLQGGYNASGKGVAPVAMKIAIHSGKVHVNIPSVVDESFEGMITGDPKISDAEYQQAMKRIEELASSQEKEKTKQESEDGTMQKNLADLNQTPWPDELVPNIPKASNMVFEVYDWRKEDGDIEIQVYMSKDEAEAYFSKLKDLGISQHGAYPSAQDIQLDGEGDGFDLQCAYFTGEQYLRINYYYKN